MKDGSKPERAVDFGTGVVLATPVHFAAGGATTPAPTMAEAHESRRGPRVDQSFAADKDYHSPQSLKKLDGGPSKARIAWPKPAKGYLPWHDGDASQSLNSPSSSGAAAPAS